MSKIKALILLASLFILASCTPFQDAATGAINSQTGDGAQLEPRSQALIFFPVGQVTDVLLDIQGTALRSLDPADNCTGDSAHLQCALGALAAPVTVELTGSDLSAVVSYRRGGVWRLEILTVPAADLFQRLVYPDDGKTAYPKRLVIDVLSGVVIKGRALMALQGEDFSREALLQVE